MPPPSSKTSLLVLLLLIFVLFSYTNAFLLFSLIQKNRCVFFFCEKMDVEKGEVVSGFGLDLNSLPAGKEEEREREKNEIERLYYYCK